MTIEYFVIGLFVIIFILLLFFFSMYIYLKYLLPLMPKKPDFEYVYVKEDGTVRELDYEHIKYVKIKLSSADESKLNIKNNYNQLTSENNLSGYIKRNKIPKEIIIMPPLDIYSISWIYVSLALISKKQPSTYNEISRMADGINHLVPTHEEMQTSISWLLSNGYAIKTKNKYSLTNKGKLNFEKAEKNTNKLLEIWENLRKTLPNTA